MDTHNLATLVLLAIYVSAALAIGVLALRCSKRRVVPEAEEPKKPLGMTLIQPVSIATRCETLRTKNSTDFYRALTIGPDGNVYPVGEVPSQVAQQ